MQEQLHDPSVAAENYPSSPSPELPMPPVASTRPLLLGTLALLLGSLLPQAQAQTRTDQISGLLQENNTAGLGFISRIEASPYVDGGNRRDLLPLYLYEGERFFLNADRAGFKLVDEDEHRLDLFLGRRLEGFPEDEMPDSLEGMNVRNTGVDLGLGWRYSQPWGNVRTLLMRDVGSISEGTELVVGYSRDWSSGRWTLRPERFPMFLGLPAPLAKSLHATHGDLFNAQWWRDLQTRLKAGDYPDTPPYPDALRLA